MEMKKKYLESLQMNIGNSYYEKRKHTTSNTVYLIVLFTYFYFVSFGIL